MTAPTETRDYVPLALAGMGFGIALGTTVVSGALWLLRTVQATTPPATGLDFGSAPGLILMAGTVGGMLAAGMGTWLALAPLQSTWRQGGLGMVTAFATLVSSLLALPVDQYLGRWGLLGLALLLAALSWRQWGAVGRAAREA